MIYLHVTLCSEEEADSVVEAVKQLEEEGVLKDGIRVVKTYQLSPEQTGESLVH